MLKMYALFKAFGSVVSRRAVKMPLSPFVSFRRLILLPTLFPLLNLKYLWRSISLLGITKDVKFAPGPSLLE